MIDPELNGAEFRGSIFATSHDVHRKLPRESFATPNRNSKRNISNFAGLNKRFYLADPKVKAEETNGVDLRCPISSPLMVHRKLHLESVIASGNIVVALDYVKALKDENIKLDLPSYTQLIGLLARAGAVESVNELVMEAKNEGFALDSNFYGILIDLASNLGDKDSMMRYYADMKAQGLKPSPATFRTVLDGATMQTPILTKNSFFEFKKEEAKYRARKELRRLLDIEMTRIEAAKKNEQVLQPADSEVPNPEATPYNEKMASAYAEGRFHEFLKSFLDLMKAGINPDFLTKKMLLLSFANPNEASSMYNSIEELRSQGTKFDIFTLNYVLVNFIEAKAFYPALELLNLMKRNGKHVENLEKNVMIKIYAQQGDVVGALGALEELKELGYRPDLGSYKALFDLFAKIKDEEGALKTLMDLKDQGYAPNPEMTRILRSILY